MAEQSLRFAASTLLRSTRPRSIHGGKEALRTHSRRIATANATQPTPTEQEIPWTPHPQPITPSNPQSRRATLKEAKPFSSFLTDTFNRQHDYLRISVTERCNLRCTYCMPAEGVELSPSSELLSTPEIVYLSSLFVREGVKKIRLTGGEPTIRRDIVPLMQQIGDLRQYGLKDLCITSNGISLHRKLDKMAEAGLTAVNLSLDTLDPYQFQLMTRRKGFDAVIKSLDRILEMNKLGAGIKLKLNCVVMRGVNEREILPFVELGREKDLEVRFIEYMPFDGNKWSEKKMVPYQEMLAMIREKYPNVGRVQDHPSDVSKTYKIPGFYGRIGFITSMSDSFCGTCSRLRLSQLGNLKVCLFGQTEVSLRDILREGNGGKPIDQEAMEAIKQVETDRRQALPGSTGVLGVSTREARLLDVIGAAVKRKKAAHAGIGQLEHMPNKSMTLIDDQQPLNSTNATMQPIPGFWRKLPTHLLPVPGLPAQQTRAFCTSFACSGVGRPSTEQAPDLPLKSHADGARSSSQGHHPSLTHLDASGEVHMVSISSKQPSRRLAIAISSIRFSNGTPHSLIMNGKLAKGDAFAVARVAGIQAAKKTSDLIPLAHPGLGITGVNLGVVSIQPGPDEDDFGSVKITATVECEGKTGVEMEAITAASLAGLTIYDMFKAVDRGMVMEGVRVIRKEGGKSGTWVFDTKEEAVR